ncbi:MAG: 2-oxoglutarate dehydrogenase E1 component, partial [Marinoscillum sp.]
MDKYSYISNADVGYIDDLYKSYKADPSNVDETWQKFFEGYEFSLQKFGENGAPTGELEGSKEIMVRNLIYAHRSRAHLKSDTNPVRARRAHNVRLELENFGLSKADL